jgi:uncharacterized protein (TIGR00290 family)
MPHKTFFNWSTGKDSALALYRLLQEPDYSVGTLITTVNSHYNRVSMHGLRNELMHAQIKAIGLPLKVIELPEQPDMDTYSNIMFKALNELKLEGFTHSAFGDIFLEDLKAYRETQLASINLQGVFPIWKRDTKDLLQEFLDLGFKTIIVAASAKYFDEDFVGTIIDRDFIANLPEDVDPCGENGEFHTFCFDGPIFKEPVKFELGKKTYKSYKNPDTEAEAPESGFWFVDLF